MHPLLRFLLLFLIAGAALGSERTVVDLAGREVVLPDPVERILLGEGRFVPALAILEREDPLARVVGMLGEFERFDPASYAQYRERFPEIDDIVRTGRSTGESFSIEQALALRADLAIFGLEGHGPSPHDRETLRRLEAAGVAVLFIDFRSEPILNTPPSIALLGEALGRRAEAQEFLHLYRWELERVTARLADATTGRPSVFIENHVGLSQECCSTMGDGMMGRFVELAGGRNIARELIPGTHGTLSLEFLLTEQPEVYIGTAIGRDADDGARNIVLGAGVTQKVARDSLRRATQRRGISGLKAIGDGRAFGIWHHFYTSPLNVAAVQVFAKWLHPDLFHDLDPDATLRMLHERFQPVPLDGTYWVGLQ
ncbi:ABC-type Fe3+-hydroxamate transport system periplasmic component-like protein [Thioalkalivibrio nitratireducens DSM 14787]|uniref:ABC-type Fe3+-hydroxamate transport system periplasmic component-like protein n=1 Tax=Thioalkalivibrio nitratireducens (strain DSM 14787 / UNIQEM 213 / ALEN2) TaxID=1255043 RepID=L0E0X2_THIND|nr:ABC transporter substrate-binding protein [Thioalkalivibrio nitratireducens]AGA34301.1 ABC-type Fe3+-hydroxamate transport system periplasmic component-like protein [Thioalkalivibrio nitratireducens DSM 14787]